MIGICLLLNKKNIYKLVILSQIYLIHGSEASVTRTYKEVFDPLVQAVLDNDPGQVLSELKKGECSPYQRLPFWYTLRHVAPTPEINTLLLHCHLLAGSKHKVGVAPKDEIHFALVPAHIIDGYSPSEFYSQPYCADYLATVSKFERDPELKDIYGKFPEDYSYEERAIMAKRIRENHYAPCSKEE